MKECTGTYDTNIEAQEVLGKNKTRKTNKHVNIDDNIKSLGFKEQTLRLILPVMRIWIRMDPELLPGSGTRKIQSWIRIQNKSFWIRNTVYMYR